jgi:hypothetical protein
MLENAENCFGFVGRGAIGLPSSHSQSNIPMSVRNSKIPATQKHPPRPKSQRDAQTASARQANRDKSKERDQYRKLMGMKKPHELRSLPTKPVGATWMLDEVITACLSQDDAIESRRITDAMIQKAAMGDTQAANFLAERSQGKPLQKIQVAGGLSIESLDKLLPDAGASDGHGVD